MIPRSLGIWSRWKLKHGVDAYFVRALTFFRSAHPRCPWHIHRLIRCFDIQILPHSLSKRRCCAFHVLYLQRLFTLTQIVSRPFSHRCQCHFGSENHRRLSHLLPLLHDDIVLLYFISECLGTFLHIAHLHLLFLPLFFASPLNKCPTLPQIYLLNLVFDVVCLSEKMSLAISDG